VSDTVPDPTQFEREAARVHAGRPRIAKKGLKGDAALPPKIAGIAASMTMLRPDRDHTITHTACEHPCSTHHL